jgi:hypothetical protein
MNAVTHIFQKTVMNQKNKKDLNKPLELAEFLKNEYLTIQKTPPNDTIINTTLSKDETSNHDETT